MQQIIGLSITIWCVAEPLQLNSDNIPKHSSSQMLHGTNEYLLTGHPSMRILYHPVFGGDWSEWCFFNFSEEVFVPPLRHLSIFYTSTNPNVVSLETFKKKTTPTQHQPNQHQQLLNFDHWNQGTGVGVPWSSRRQLTKITWPTSRKGWLLVGRWGV